MNEIIIELKKFLKEEYWVFIIFFICLFFIFKTNTWNVYEILIVFIFHLIADICMMITWKSYSHWKMKVWSKFQLIGNNIVNLIAIYSWIINWKWNYLATQIWFTISAFWNYFKFYKNKSIDLFNARNLIIISIFVSFFYIYFWFIDSYHYLIQYIWLVIFPIWLTISNDNLKYYVCLLWNFIITLWSFLILWNSYKNANIVWVDISFTLLPLTVLISYLKNLKYHLWKN